MGVGVGLQARVCRHLSGRIEHPPSSTASPNQVNSHNNSRYDFHQATPMHDFCGMGWVFGLEYVEIYLED